MRKIILKFGFWTLDFLRECFDPAWEKSPYDRALQQEKKDQPAFSNRWLPRRRIVLR